MMLWLLITILCSATAVVVSIPLIRRYEDRKGSPQDQAIYQDQLNEVDRDESSGTIDAPEAKAARIEIHRRLAETKSMTQQARPLSPSWKMLVLALTAGMVILGGVSLYGIMGAPDVPSVSNAQAPAIPLATGPGQVETMIVKLQARLQTNPKDAEGWRMLGWAQFNTQNYAASADAYAKASEIDPTNIDYKSAFAESLVQSAEGIVTPKAQGLFAEVLAKDPKEFRARYYDALAHEQSGDQNGALDRWIALLADAPADAGWRDDVKQRIVNLGKTLSRDVSAAVKLPKLDPASPQKPLASDERNAMVVGMIAKLATKLEANPRDRDGWAMMIRSLAVTGDKKGAADALNKAIGIFKDDQSTIDGLQSIAKAAGVGMTTAVPNPPAPTQ